ncbi:MAG: formate dehydrogenase accessory sulfurtransferase FdhD [Micromonosporaceae bacterium]|nr:formate dehydrogenase accessory sulfurtransferase FdhD [Micromonosporaceae bacterium]
MSMRPGSTTRARVRQISGGEELIRRDSLATEEPLELRLVAGVQKRTLAVTMRTPGNDFELAAGFLHGESVVTSQDEIAQISYCTDPGIDAEQRYNIVNVALRSGTLPELPGLERHFATSSACGVCGKASLDALKLNGCSALDGGPVIDTETLYGLPDAIRAAQGVFESTGGLHAAALFTPAGELVALREDIGRHNAVDKLVGWALLNGHFPLSDNVLMVSGRAGYEILQKALAAGIAVVAAVSAPSSLAVALANDFHLTLVGFLRGRRCNVYAGEERIRLPLSTATPV